MIRRSSPKARSGITLVEILISIMILGVGVISLATLFPIGLIRLRNAQRMTRGGFLVESAAADLGARNLLAPSLIQYSPAIWPCYTTGSGFYSPYVQDTPTYGADWGPPATTGTPAGAYHPFGSGLPVAFDPLWRAVATWNGVQGVYLPGSPGFVAGTPEARFGQASGFSEGTTAEMIRLDPADSKLASANGLQRVSSIPPALYLAAIDTFVSPEDLVLQDPKGAYYQTTTSSAFINSDDVAKYGMTTSSQLTNPSPVVPLLSYNGFQPTVVNDWRFSWLFTGQQTTVSGGGVVFDGDIVVCENRSFGIDVATSPFPSGGTSYQVAGETVVEAVWGYSATGNPGSLYASPSANRTVLLRWPSTMPDPDIKVGGWIADVTYERTTTRSGRFSGPYPPQRCFWYQIAKRTDPSDGGSFPGDSSVTYRQMTVWTSTPLRAMTPLNFAGTSTSPIHVEAALIMPSVVNVYPRTVYTR